MRAMSVLADPALERVLARLHALSDGQIDSLAAHYSERERQASSPGYTDLAHKTFLRDKLVALDRDKAEFCYQLCRANGARHIVEIGTSYGVSTLYLAAALRDNVIAGGDNGIVIGTEYEPDKAVRARAHFAEAGLSQFIELREGDLRETLRQIDVPIDFVLVDIWIGMARPALELVAPRLRAGAMVVCDNTQRYRHEYADYLAFVGDPGNGFRTMTLPFNGGLELSVAAKPPQR
jgi:predicted O-methyltransferase YrrM